MWSVAACKCTEDIIHERCQVAGATRRNGIPGQQVEPQDDDDDDNDEDGSKVLVVVLIICHHRRDRLSRYGSALMPCVMGNTERSELAQVWPLRSRSLAPRFAWNFK